MDAVQIKGLSEINEAFESALQRFPEIRRQAFEDSASQLRQAVTRGIGGTGKVQSWQQSQIGSGGGYVAVRPMTFDDGIKYFNIGQQTYIGITAAIEHGHRVRKGYQNVRTKHGKWVRRKNYRKKADKVQYVNGKHMYYKAQGDAEAIARKLRDKLESEMTRLLEVR